MEQDHSNSMKEPLLSKATTDKMIHVHFMNAMQRFFSSHCFMKPNCRPDIYIKLLDSSDSDTNIVVTLLASLNFIVYSWIIYIIWFSLY